MVHSISTHLLGKSYGRYFHNLLIKHFVPVALISELDFIFELFVRFFVSFYLRCILTLLLVPVYILSKLSACKVVLTLCTGDKQIAPFVKEGASVLRVCCLRRFIASGSWRHNAERFDHSTH